MKYILRKKKQIPLVSYIKGKLSLTPEPHIHEIKGKTRL